MEKETITIAIDKESITKLRKLAVAQKTKKGFLGKVISEALKEYLKEKEQEEARERLIARLKKGYHLGGSTIKHRDELYDRG